MTVIGKCFKIEEVNNTIVTLLHFCSVYYSHENDDVYVYANYAILQIFFRLLNYAYMTLYVMVLSSSKLASIINIFNSSIIVKEVELLLSSKSNQRCQLRTYI